MTSVEQHPFQPDYAIPPGETLRDRLAEMNLSQTEAGGTSLGCRPST